jgi:hypothetical protein
VFSGNVYKNSHASFTVDVGNIIFDNESSVGKKKQALSSVTTQGDFWYNYVDDSIYLYSAASPAVQYTSAECALAGDIAYNRNKTGVTYDNLYFRYGASHGIGGGGGTVNTTVDNCWFRYIGGSDINGLPYTVRYGNGVEFWDNNNTSVVKNSWFDHIYDAAMTSQGTTDGTHKINETFINNVVTNSEYSFEFFHRGASSSVDNVLVANNTALDAGGGWGHNQRWDSANGRHIRFSLNTATTTNFKFRNNIFDAATESCIAVIATDDVADFSSDNNIFNCATVARVSTTNYTTLADWQFASSQDASSVDGNPLLQPDYSLYSGSPAIDAGVDLSIYFTDDYYGHPRRGAWDIGAIEAGVMESQGVGISGMGVK